MHHCQDHHPETLARSTCHPPGIVAALTLALVATGIFLVAAGCRSSQQTTDRQLERFEFSQAQMGLDFRITLFAPDESVATVAVTAAYTRIAELNAILSDYDSDSELSRLSRTSGTDRWVPVSDDLWIILATGRKLSVESDGAFDLTIGPSVNLWRRARRQKKLPDEDLLNLMKDRVGYQYLLLDARTRSAKLTRPDMRLDAGGIAKGYAMDEAMNVMSAFQITRAMIQGGGDLVCGDPPPGKPGWRIRLSESNSPALLLSNCALATSGDLFQFLEIDGVRYSHIVDPRTGVGLTNRSLVHVIAPRGITADSLSTTLNVLGNEESRALLAGFPHVEFRMTSVEAGDQITAESGGFTRSLE